jgi:hypothetical protein
MLTGSGAKNTARSAISSGCGQPTSREPSSERAGIGHLARQNLTFPDIEDGRTLVELTDGEWREGDPPLPFCIAHWAKCCIA